MSGQGLVKAGASQRLRTSVLLPLPYSFPVPVHTDQSANGVTHKVQCACRSASSLQFAAVNSELAVDVMIDVIVGANDCY